MSSSSLSLLKPLPPLKKRSNFTFGKSDTNHTNTNNSQQVQAEMVSIHSRSTSHATSDHHHHHNHNHHQSGTSSNSHEPAQESSGSSSSSAGVFKLNSHETIHSSNGNNNVGNTSKLEQVLERVNRSQGGAHRSYDQELIEKKNTASPKQANLDSSLSKTAAGTAAATLPATTKKEVERKCSYVKVIVNASGKLDHQNRPDNIANNIEKMCESSGSGSTAQCNFKHNDESDSNSSTICTLKLERIFTDNYLLQAWEKCQFIDLFLYSNIDEPKKQCLVPAHRLLLSAYSGYCRRFFDTYPDPVKFVDQLQTFLKEIGTESVVNSKWTNHHQKNDNTEIGDDSHSNNNELHTLTLSALGCSTIPVLSFAVPSQDLQDLIKLMYRGTIQLEKSRLESIQNSAHQLKMSSVYVEETNTLLIDAQSNMVPLNGSRNTCKKQNDVTEADEVIDVDVTGCQCEHVTCKCSSNANANAIGDDDNKKMSIVANATTETSELDRTKKDESNEQTKVNLQTNFDNTIQNINDNSNSSSTANSNSNSSTSSGGGGELSAGIELPASLTSFFYPTSASPSKTAAIDVTKDGKSVSTGESAKKLIDTNAQFVAPSMMESSMPTAASTAPAVEQKNIDLSPLAVHINKHTTSTPFFMRSHSLNELQHDAANATANATAAAAVAAANVATSGLFLKPNSLLSTLDAPLGLKRKEPTSRLNSFEPFNALNLMANFTNPLGHHSFTNNFLTDLSSESLLSSGAPSPTALLSPPILQPKFSNSLNGVHHQHHHHPLSPYLGKTLDHREQNSLTSLMSAPLVPLFQRQFSAPANLMSPLSPTPPIVDNNNPFAASFAAESPPDLSGKVRRGRKQTLFDSSPRSFSGDCSVTDSGPNSPQSEHQTSCPVGSLNCRKRCQNLYHAAKYRDRRRQRMEQLYQEKELLEKAQNGYVTKINLLKTQISNLIQQRTQYNNGVGQVCYRCPVCMIIFVDLDTIRAHLNAEHHEYAKMSTTPTPMDAKDMSAHLRSLTKDWLILNNLTNNNNNVNANTNTAHNETTGPASKKLASLVAAAANPQSKLSELPRMVPFA